MFKVFHSVLVMASLALSANVQANDHVFLARQDSADIYLASARTISKGTLRDTWILHNVATADIRTDGLRYRSTLFHIEYDCAIRTKRILSFEHYAQQMATGKPGQTVNLVDLRIDETRPLVPGSADETVARTVCHTPGRVAIGAWGAGPQWLPVFTSEDIVKAIDKNSIIKTAQGVRVWERTDFAVDQIDTDGGKSRSFLVLLEFNCTQRTKNSLMMEVYRDPAAKGEVLMSSLNRANSVPTAIAPGSLVEQVFKAACALVVP
jgi:hypothetical protein